MKKKVNWMGFLTGKLELKDKYQKILRKKVTLTDLGILAIIINIWFWGIIYLIWNTSFGIEYIFIGLLTLKLYIMTIGFKIILRNWLK